MLLENNISEIGKKKLQLYMAAMHLFDKGKSHPQIVAMLEEYEPNKTFLTPLVDKAMHDEWDILYQEARNLFSEGKNYDEVLKTISQKEPDMEIATWICKDWYKLKAFYAECLIDGSTNRFEGMKWVIICGVAIFIVFYAGASWVTKTIWIIAIVVSIFQWIVGMQQRDLSNIINRIFTLDIEKVPEEQNKK
jgi:hypothetical protein